MSMITRTEFVQKWAKNSGCSDELAILGMVELANNWKMIALPCACDSEMCEGWAMIGIENVSHYLFFDAPEGIVSEYRKALLGRGQEMP